MEGPPPGIAAPVPPRHAAAAGDLATQRHAAALAAFDGAREGPKPAAPRRAFDTWRDLTRLRRLYAASKVVPSDVWSRCARRHRGMLYAPRVASLNPALHSSCCGTELSVPTALLKVARAFLAWQQLLQLLSLYKGAARRETAMAKEAERAGKSAEKEVGSNARKMLLDLGSDRPRMLTKYPVDELLFRARVKYQPSKKLVEQPKKVAGRGPAATKKRAAREDQLWNIDTKIDREAPAARAPDTHKPRRKAQETLRAAGERLHATAARAAEDFEKQRAARRLEAQRREDAELTGRPAICRKMGRHTKADERKLEGETIADSLLRRRADKEARVQEQQEELARRRSRQADPRTYMSKETRRITDHMDRGMPVEDVLIAQGELSKQRRNYLRHRKEQEERISIEMGPSITHTADTLDRDGDICERLYDQAVRKDRSDTEKQQEPLFDPETGQRFFSPAINAASWKIVRSEPVEEALFRESEDYLLRQQQRERRKDAEQHMASLQPKMVPYSQLLVDLMEMRNGAESTAERLRKPTRCIKPATLEALEKAEEECTPNARPLLCPSSLA